MCFSTASSGRWWWWEAAARLPPGQREAEVAREALGTPGVVWHVELLEERVGDIEERLRLGLLALSVRGDREIHLGARQLVTRMYGLERRPGRVEVYFSLAMGARIDCDPPERKPRPALGHADLRVGGDLETLAGDIPREVELTLESVGLGQKGREPALKRAVAELTEHSRYV